MVHAGCRLRAKRHGLLKINTSPIAKKEGLAMIPGGRDVLGCVAPNANMPCVDAGDLRANQHTGLVALHTVSLSFCIGRLCTVLYKKMFRFFLEPKR